ncbi:MAG: hypothetical protein ABR915_11380 [Thermoguttaceae bacterium]
MEVLISVFVLSVGMLGLAALLPVGSFTILEAVKADRSGDCGRAALRDVKVRRMLDSRYWSAAPSSGLLSFVIDPLGVANSAPGTVAGTTLPRIAIATDANGKAINPQAIFVSPDDLIVAFPEQDNSSPRKPFGRSYIPAYPDPNNPGATVNNSGDYSWFLSVMQTSDPMRFGVTVVVCYKRDFTAERAVQVPTSGFLDVSGGLALGGGSIQLGGPINDAPGSATLGIRVKANDWVALYSSSSGLCCWYRVLAISDLGPAPNYVQSLTLAGPDWLVTTDPSKPDYVIAMGQSVIGAYSTTVELDQDPAWQQ